MIQLKILLISDNPERESFRQILKLKSDIEKIIKKRLDLITISQNGIFLNQKIIAKPYRGRVLTVLESVLQRRNPTGILDLIWIDNYVVIVAEVFRDSFT